MEDGIAPIPQVTSLPCCLFDGYPRSDKRHFVDSRPRRTQWQALEAMPLRLAARTLFRDGLPVQLAGRYKEAGSRASAARTRS